jgi:hypothetical protein
MRPGQNKRMRGRNNRKGPNPLTRSYESNGPDVKIRGTAHHVAEKYLQLARDAQSSGDPVMAESYLQHAEHYFRIIAAAQLAQQQAQVGYSRPPGEADAEDDDDDDDAIPDRFASPLERLAPPPAPAPYQGNQPQQSYGQPQQGYQGQQPYAERNDRQTGFNGNNNGDRGQRQDRPFQDRNNNRFNQNRQQRDNNRPREFRNDRNDRQDRNDAPRDNQRNDAPRNDPPRVDQQRVMPEDAEQPALPAFITAPVRIPTDDAPASEPTHVASGEAGDQEAGGFHLRPRRRRRRPAGAETGEASSGTEPPVSGDLPFGE